MFFSGKELMCMNLNTSFSASLGWKMAGLKKKNAPQ